MAETRGRPLKFRSAKELQEKIDSYFKSCHEEVWTQNADGKWIPALDRNGEVITRQIKPYTISGLAVHLGTSRETLLEYEQRESYVDTIKKAKNKIESFAEEQLFTSRNVAGVIFNLKNNYNKWSDKPDAEERYKKLIGLLGKLNLNEDEINELVSHL